MNKGMKITAIVATSFITIGLIVFLVSGGINSLSKAQGYNEKSVERVYVAKSAVTDVNVDVVNSKIEVIPSDVKTLKITYVETYDDQYKLEEYNNAFKMSEKKLRFNFFDFHWLFNSFNRNVILTIEIPKNTELTNGSIVTVNGLIDINNLKAQEMNVRTVNGMISIENVKSDDIALNTVNGGIVFEDVNAPKINAESVNGRIEITNAKFETLKLKTVNGSMNIDELVGSPNDYDISFSSVNGKLYIDDSRVSNDYYSSSNKGKSITASSVNGRFTINSK